MEKLLEKLSDYNLFTNLLPGVIFVAFNSIYLHVIITTDTIWIDVFLCYFYGVVISRVSSIAIEPILKKYIKHSKFEDFCFAEQRDAKIHKLLESNNLYRSFIALCFIGFIFIGANWIFDIYSYNCEVNCMMLVGTLLLVLLFVLSYSKQTSYIVKRVNNQVNNKINE